MPCLDPLQLKLPCIQSLTCCKHHLEMVLAMNIPSPAHKSCVIHKWKTLIYISTEVPPLSF